VQLQHACLVVLRKLTLISGCKDGAAV